MAADLEIRIGAEFTEVKAALAALKKDLAGVGIAANKANRGSGLEGIESSLKSAGTALKGLIGGFAAFATIKSLVTMADDISTLNARLKLVTRSTDEFVRAQDDLFELSQRTRSSLSETTDLYTRLAQATKESGISQARLLAVTETVNQAVQLSGVSAVSAQQALIQFGQGLASGTLRGEELNSILEQTPALADAIASGLGVARGDLRRLGEQGKLTSEDLLRALEKVAPQVSKQFATLPLTVGQSITKVSNSFQRLVGVFDAASGATGGLAAAIDGLATFLSSDAVTSGVAEFATIWRQAFTDIAADAKRAIDLIFSATDAVGIDFGSIFGFLGTAIRDLPINLRAAVRIAVVTFAGMIDSFRADLVFLREAVIAFFGDGTIEAALARRNRTVGAVAESVKEQIGEIVDEAQKQKRDAEEAVAKAKKDRDAAKARARANSGAAGGPKRPGLSAVSDVFELQKDAQQRALKELQFAYDEAKVSLDDYLRTRVALQTAAVDAEIAIERRRLGEAVKAKKQDDANKAATKLAILERDRSDILAQADRDRTVEARAQASERAELTAKEFERVGNVVEAAKIRVAAQYDDLLKRLRAQADSEGVAIIQRLIDTDVARAQFAKLSQDAEKAQAELSRRLQAVADQRSAGAITQPAAEAAQSEARQRAADELARVSAEMQKLAIATNDPQIVAGANAVADALARIKRDGLTGTDAAIANLIASLDNLKSNFATMAADAGVSALEGLFLSLGDSSTSAKDKIKDFVRSFAQSMAQIAARALATYAVLQLLEAIFPGAGKLVAAGGGSAANVKHSGGRVGAGRQRTVSPLLFAGAPRFHGGGMAGLKPDEVPAILQRGEEVLSRDDPRNAANAGGGGVRIVNAIDPNLVGDYMNSSGGERTIVNLIQRNRGQIKQLLG